MRLKIKASLSQHVDNLMTEVGASSFVSLIDYDQVPIIVQNVFLQLILVITTDNSRTT